jgi:hypothetical protein
MTFTSRLLIACTVKLFQASPSKNLSPGVQQFFDATQNWDLQEIDPLLQPNLNRRGLVRQKFQNSLVNDSRSVSLTEMALLPSGLMIEQLPSELILSLYGPMQKGDNCLRCGLLIFSISGQTILTD